MPGVRRDLRFARAGLVLLATCLGVAYSFVTPLGEAPDEAAHVYYLDQLLESGALPRYAPAAERQSYEAHQPPLDYVLVACAARALGVGPIGFPFVPNPDLDFRSSASRAFLPVAAPPDAVRRFHVVRLIRLAWLPLTLLAIAGAVGRVVGAGSHAGLAAICLVGLAPQLLHTSATFNNDGGVVAFSCLCLLLLLRLVGSVPFSPGLALLAGASAACAILSKGSGLALVAPLGLAAWWALRGPRGWRVAAALLAPLALAGAALLALNALRFGTPRFAFPAAPGHDVLASALRLVAEPEWLATLWSSFWARFGWFNLPLPVAAYALFLPATVAVGIGLLARASERGGRAAEQTASRRRRLAACALAANLLLVVAFMVAVNWQPQGRLLLPSLGALAVLAASGIESGWRRWRGDRAGPSGAVLAGLALAAMVAVNLLGLIWIGRAYR